MQAGCRLAACDNASCEGAEVLECEAAGRRPHMNRIAHRIIMVVLLAAALAIIWNVLGGR
jgi:hypothetical protein